ncbi:MAG: YicC/YloC family endoribonuclease [Clostridia bacterium]|nr:YicC/YloC family endoribonuclease [Clostridia bacterium]
MNSMTGYGRHTAQRDGRQLTIELKSVNHRYLDLSFRMPRAISFLEEDARKLLSARLSRGHVDLFASYVNTRDDAVTVVADMTLFSAYEKALEELRGKSDLEDDRTLMALARMPDVLRVEQTQEDAQALKELMNEALSGALDEMSAMRSREGQSLKVDLLSRIDELERLNGVIKQRYPDTVAEYTRRLRERVEELLGQNIDEMRLMQEVAIMADRSSISEEVVRIESHIAQIRESVESPEAVGRKLDFIVQELNREMNTISSKSQDIPITQAVVAAKSEIDKLREQVQNIE